MMQFFGFRNPCKTGNVETFAPGEVLNGKYRVMAVEVGEDERPQYKCMALHTHEEVLVCCVGHKERSTDPSTWLLTPNEAGLVESAGDGESSYLDRFEVQSGKNTLIYVVQAKRMNAFSVSSNANQERHGREIPSRDSDIEYQRLLQEPEQRPGPRGSRILIYRRGDGNLEVDIPAYVFGLFTVYMIVSFALWLGFTLFLTLRAVSITIANRNPARFLLFLKPVLFWIFGFFILGLTVRMSFTHENLTISPTSFRIKRTVEFWRRHRDSINNAARAEAPLTCMDRLFCRQLEGATQFLTVAKRVREVAGRRKSEWLVLVIGLADHTLYNHLSLEEMNWLLSEISGTLREVGESRVSR